LDNVCLPFYLSRREGGVIEKALSLLEQAGIPYLARIYPRQLSGGELRRVSIARALINDPQLLIADEPTADLDADTTVEIMKLFSRIARNGTAILMVTHDRDAEAYCNRSYSMQSGTLTAS
jgi:putative ABC transport system ATP-binding protein